MKATILDYNAASKLQYEKEKYLQYSVMCCLLYINKNKFLETFFTCYQVYGSVFSLFGVIV